jgi:hypothetical protein
VTGTDRSRCGGFNKRGFVVAIVILTLTSLACNLSSATPATLTPAAVPAIETPELANTPAIMPISPTTNSGVAPTVTLGHSPSAATVSPLAVSPKPDISSENTPAATETLFFDASCPNLWFFPDGPEACPAEAALYSGAAEQHFENGVMVWVGAEDRIYVLYFDDPLPKWIAFVDEWEEGQPEYDPALVPPDGLRQPVRGFGLIWREQPGVRERLGWAIDREAGYATAVQRTFQANGNGYDIYLQAIDGNIWLLLRDGIGWEKIPI